MQISELIEKLNINQQEANELIENLETEVNLYYLLYLLVGKKEWKEVKFTSRDKLLYDIRYAFYGKTELARNFIHPATITPSSVIENPSDIPRENFLVEAIKQNLIEVDQSDPEKLVLSIPSLKTISTIRFPKDIPSRQLPTMTEDDEQIIGQICEVDLAMELSLSSKITYQAAQIVSLLLQHNGEWVPVIDVIEATGVTPKEASKARTTLLLRDDQREKKSPLTQAVTPINPIEIELFHPDGQLSPVTHMRLNLSKSAETAFKDYLAQE